VANRESSLLGASGITILVGLSKIRVEAQCRNCHRAARLVVAGIVDVLQVEGAKKPPPKVDGVEAL